MARATNWRVGGMVALLTGCSYSCSCTTKNEPASRAESAPRVVRAFHAGLRQYRLARANGLDLAKPGLGGAPISAVRTYELYRNVFHVPEELEPLLATEEGREYLRLQVNQAREPDARTLASACSSIANSTNRLRRHRIFIEVDGAAQEGGVFRGCFILYHYD